MPPEIQSSTFYQLALVLLAAAVLGAVAIRLRQPLIVAFIAVGILVGPGVLGWVTPDAHTDWLAMMGISILLFLVGLKLDLQLIRTMGAVALATGLGQVLFTSFVGFGLAILLGLGTIEAVYVAVALTFSSTIIIVKLLSDKREIDKLHGRIATGFLIVQDIVVVLVMIVLTAIGVQGDAVAAGSEMLLVLVKGIAFVAGIGLAMKFVLPYLLHVIAASSELLVIFAIAWAVCLASIGDYLGFSKEVGAFMGGVALASTHYREAIGARLVSLRDFLLLFFFVDLAGRLELGMLGEQVFPAIILSLFVLIGNPLIVMVVMGVMGYRKRTGFLAGLTVAQISEFSLILAALGLSLGHITESVIGLITLVGLVTIGLSTYMIIYSQWLYDQFKPWLGIFERKVPHREIAAEEAEGQEISPEVVLFGFGRLGSSIYDGLTVRGLRVIVIDFDPVLVNTAQASGIPVHYGDAEDPEFPSSLPLDEARWVVCTVPERDVALGLVRVVRNHGFSGRLALTALQPADEQAMYDAGADLVLRPFQTAGDVAVQSMLEIDAQDRAEVGG